MFKNIIAPVQAWLLSKGQCVGCSMPLDKATRSKSKVSGFDQVTCKCGRIFLFDPDKKIYRRALMSEI